MRILGEAMMILNPSNDTKTKLKKKLEERNNQLVIQPAGPYDHFHEGLLDHHIDHHKAHDLDDHDDKKPTMHIKKDVQESEMYEDLLLKWHPIFLIPNKLQPNVLKDFNQISNCICIINSKILLIVWFFEHFFLTIFFLTIDFQESHAKIYIMRILLMLGIVVSSNLLEKIYNDKMYKIGFMIFSMYAVFTSLMP